MNGFEISYPAWMANAVCASVDPGLFFPEKGESTKAAKKICGTCPAAVACLAWAVAECIPHGIYGGVTAFDRRVPRAAA